MTYQWSAKKIARLVRLPEHGVMAVLEFYMDDSGTHGMGPVVIWGALLGQLSSLNILKLNGTTC